MIIQSDSTKHCEPFGIKFLEIVTRGIIFLTNIYFSLEKKQKNELCKILYLNSEYGNHLSSEEQNKLNKNKKVKSKTYKNHLTEL